MNSNLTEISQATQWKPGQSGTRGAMQSRLLPLFLTVISARSRSSTLVRELERRVRELERLLGRKTSGCSPSCVRPGRRPVCRSSVSLLACMIRSTRLPQSARQNPTASRRHSSKPSNAIMLGCRSCRMLETVIALLPAWFEDYNEGQYTRTQV